MCAKALPQGPDSRVGGTQNKGKLLRPFNVPFKLPALAASMLYCEKLGDVVG
jgi:hypothetical protein